MRARITNLSDHVGHLAVTYGDGDEEKLPRPQEIDAGESREYAITMRGHITLLDFKAHVVSVPKNKPKALPKQTAQGDPMK